MLLSCEWKKFILKDSAKILLSLLFTCFIHIALLRQWANFQPLSTQGKNL